MKIKGLQPGETPAQPHPQSDRVWEYATVTAEAESQDLLANYGARGWELVAVVKEFGTRVVFYFKRRRQ
ncbi:MAG: hypothetical protein IT165_25245 [Bryobacterales bacterium]|nr:hypothetical protein [Bryobacterales bacterium]